MSKGAPATLKINKDGDNIKVGPQEGTSEKKNNPAKKSQKEKKFRVIINSQEGFEGKDDLKLGVNGRVFQVKRGFEVDLPESYLAVLKDAKYTIITKDDNGNEDIREVPRFSYNILGQIKEGE